MEQDKEMEVQDVQSAEKPAASAPAKEQDAKKKALNAARSEQKNLKKQIANRRGKIELLQAEVAELETKLEDVNARVKELETDTLFGELMGLLQSGKLPIARLSQFVEDTKKPAES